MFLIIVTVIFVIENVSSNQSEPDHGLNLEACDVGDVVQNECSKCICTARHLYDCTSKDCPETNKNSNETQANINSRSCHPHKIYNLNGTICICNPDGRWPHKSCHSIFRSLPETNTIKQKCIPNSYVVIDCNICRCNGKGQIDDQRCTKNECKDPIKDKADHRRNSKGGDVYGKCRAKNWYSFAPCQFCYCLNNNKLMCNTGVANRNSIKLGTYNFSVCGTDLLKEALELTPDGKEAGNIVSKDTKIPDIPEPIKKETTIKTVDKSDFKGIGLQMDMEARNNDVDDKVKKDSLRIKTTKTQIEESQDVSESEDESGDGKEKFTQQPYEDSANKDKGSDSNGGRTEDRDDKDDENVSESESEESIPIKPIAREPPDSISDKQAEENESQGSISIKFDMKKAQREPIKKKTRAKEQNKQNKLSQTKDNEENQKVEFDFGNAIKNNLPLMFSKVLSNLRKTVSLEFETDCVPGTSINVKCNVCHCLKNKKMICTNKKCK